MRRSDVRAALFLFLMVACAWLAACGGNKPPVARPAPPPPATPPAAATPAARPPTPPQPVAEPTVVPQEPVRADTISSAALDDIDRLNRSSPLKPAFFDYDSS